METFLLLLAGLSVSVIVLVDAIVDRHIQSTNKE